MTIRSLGASNYKGFRDAEALTLAPLTLLLGRNNSGKSALARLPLLLGASLAPSAPATPVDIDAVPGDLGGSFLDLIYGRRPHGSIGLSVEFESNADFRLAVTIQNVDEFQLQVVSNFELVFGPQRLTLSWDYGDPRPGARTYVCSLNDEIFFTGAIPFEGILPQLHLVDGITTPEEVIVAIAAARESCDQMSYLGPFRAQPERLYRLPSREVKTVGQTGSFAPAAIADDSLRGTGELLAAINKSIGSILAGWELEVDIRANTFTLNLVSKTDRTVSVNIADTGTGVAQVLPVYVQSVLNNVLTPRRPLLQIIEQPELHLHPAAHADLAELFLAGINQGMRYIIETHSETLLLRLRRHVAQGLDPASIAIYYVDPGSRTKVRRIGLDSLGNVDYWPEGVFAEDYDEARDLASAQLERTPKT